MDPYILPTFTPPKTRPNVTLAQAGALTRVFDLIVVLKRSSGYTEAIGVDM